MRLSCENLCDFRLCDFLATFRLFPIRLFRLLLATFQRLSKNKFHQVVEKFLEFARVNFRFPGEEVYN
nr:MAG TPA: hypothetical protein [Caudoviricetes sp.]